MNENEYKTRPKKYSALPDMTDAEKETRKRATDNIVNFWACLFTVSPLAHGYALFFFSLSLFLALNQDEIALATFLSSL